MEMGMSRTTDRTQMLHMRCGVNDEPLLDSAAASTVADEIKRINSRVNLTKALESIGGELLEGSGFETQMADDRYTSTSSLGLGSA
jgi:hypothetical protein